jgi:hypothetical protein
MYLQGQRHHLGAYVCPTEKDPRGPYFTGDGTDNDGRILEFKGTSHIVVDGQRNEDKRIKTYGCLSKQGFDIFYGLHFHAEEQINWPTLLEYAAGLRPLDPVVEDNVEIVRIAQRPLLQSIKHVKQTANLVPIFTIGTRNEHWRKYTSLGHISFS